MKLNSRKKNIGKFWISIFFILVFYLFFHFYSNKILLFIENFKENQKIIFLEKEKLLDKNKILEEKNKFLKSKNIFSEYYYNRTQELEKKLNYWNKNNIKRKSFKIFYNKKNSFYNPILVKNYLNSAIKKNDLVYLKDNFAIGRVSFVDTNKIKIKQFSDFGFKEKYLIMQDGKILIEIEGVGDSNGIIKINLPREIVPDKNSVLFLNNKDKSIVASFLKDDFQKQKINREVYYKVFYNPYILTEVEI